MARNDGMVFGVGIAALVGLALVLVNKKSAPPVGTADLRIESLARSPSALTLGYGVPFTLTITVKNYGDVTGSLDVWTGWIMDPSIYNGSDPEVQRYKIDNPQRIALGPGETGTLTRSGFTLNNNEWWDGRFWVWDYWDMAWDADDESPTIPRADRLPKESQLPGAIFNRLSVRPI
jgi:hypothetical protein